MYIFFENQMQFSLKFEKKKNCITNSLYNNYVHLTGMRVQYLQFSKSQQVNAHM